MELAKDYDRTFLLLWGMHGVLFLVCLYRELYSTSITAFSNIMKFIEVISMFANLAFTIHTIDFMSVELMELFKLKESKENESPCLGNREVFHKWNRGLSTWIYIECSVFVFFILSLLLLLLKSRCMKVGIDQAREFEPENIAKMINKIVYHMDLDLLQTKLTFG